MSSFEIPGVITSTMLGVANGIRTMPSSDSLSGLMKWLAKEPWRGAFLDVLDRHVGRALDEHDISDFDELGGLIGLDWAMTLWGCAFEDFLTKDVEGAGNIVDDYLKRRGWKESARNKAYMAGLRGSMMSLYEVSDIQPGRSFLARDLIHGGESVRVSERTATKTLKPCGTGWRRIVDVRPSKELLGVAGMCTAAFASRPRVLDSFWTTVPSPGRRPATGDVDGPEVAR